MSIRTALLALVAMSFLARNADAQQREGMLKEGDAAPDFVLYDLTGKNPVKLSQFRGRAPVVLVFGSYT